VHAGAIQSEGTGNGRSNRRAWAARTLAYALGHSGLRLPYWQRGSSSPGSERLGTPAQYLGKAGTRLNETWLDGLGNEFHPAMLYFVGGSTNFMARLCATRKADFGADKTR